MKRFAIRLLTVILAIAIIAAPASALTVDEAVSLLKQYYLYELSEETENAETLEELFSLLGDPYTCYLDEEEYKSFFEVVEGDTSVVGIGVQVLLTEQGIKVIATADGGPAAQGGLLPGDMIIAVNGVSCVPADSTHQNMIVGEEGTGVTVTVRRGDQIYDYMLIRRQVVFSNVSFRLLDNRVGFISCGTFSSDVHKEFAKILTNHGHEADSWIIDLRDNPGGHVGALVELSGLFSGQGVYLFLRNRQGITEGYTTSQTSATAEPVILLVDGNSASASEAFAANMRDTGRGIIIGARTFGKGSAQSIYDATTHPVLFYGDGIKITGQRFYSSNGNTTDMIGVIPDLLTDASSADALALALSGGLQNGYMTEGYVKLEIAGKNLYFNPGNMEQGALAALLSALPPSAVLYEGVNFSGWQEISAEELADRYGVNFKSRGFDDLSESIYADEINTLGTYRLLLGDGTGKFLPEKQLTRAEICAMLSQLLNITYTGPALFKDVSGSAWYAGAVNAMAHLGFVEGVGNGMFLPNGVLTQQEYFTILGRMACYLNFNLEDFADSFYTHDGQSQLDQEPMLTSYAAWARESTAVLERGGRVLGDSRSMLFTELSETDPKEPILREEAAACLYRMLSVLGILAV